MSHFKKVFFLFLITGLFCGCFQKPFGTEYSHYDIGASLRVPENWQKAEISTAASISSMAFEDGKGGVIILTQNLETSFGKQLGITSEMNHPILEQGIVLFAKYKTKWFRSAAGRTSKITYVVKANEGRVFSVICTAPSMHLASYRSNFDQVAKSLRTF